MSTVLVWIDASFKVYNTTQCAKASFVCKTGSDEKYLLNECQRVSAHFDNVRMSAGIDNFTTLSIQSQDCQSCKC
jgi:hypothetical protein